MAMITAVTDTGAVRGFKTENPKVSAFLGIPYAKPPVGELRWKAPVPADKWDGVRDCFDYGFSCWQSPPAFPAPKDAKPDPVPNRPLRMNEDCLTINVWTPAEKGGEKLPVMLWYYGGGLQFGTSDNKTFDGETLCEYGVVLVTVNYRTGVFGYFGCEELEAENEHKSSGNYGLQDQIEALRWLKRNAEAFGGDPDNITIFGVSGGGRSVQGVCCSPLAAGMVKHAAVHSAGGLNPDYSLPYDEIKSRAKKFMKFCGKENIAQMRDLPAEKLQEYYKNFGQDNEFNITGDGWVLPYTMDEIVRRGEQADIDYILLTTNGEIPRFRKDKVTLATYGPDKFSFRNRILGQTLKPSTDEEADDITTWAEAYDMKASQLAWARIQAKQPLKNVWLCTFDRIAPGKTFASHGCEGTYIFHTFRKFATPFNEDDEKVSRELMLRWTNFAKTGDPNGEGLTDWPQFTAESQLTMSIDENGFVMKDRNNAIMDQVCEAYTNFKR